jgi:hypothetical protein
MEGLAPPLQCLIEIQSALQNGESVRSGLLRYIQSEPEGFALDVRRFLFIGIRGVIGVNSFARFAVRIAGPCLN